MTSSVRPEDPENSTSPLPKCRCLDYCIVISLVLLTMVMGSICAFYMVWERQHLVSTAEAQLKMDLQESSAQLLVDDARLKNGILNWTMSRLSDHFVGQYFEQNEQKLVIKNQGFYSISSQITLKCMDDTQCQNEEGEVSLTILNNNNNNDPEDTLLKLFIIIKKSTTIIQPASFSKIIRHLRLNDEITAELKISKGIGNWQFDREHSVLGLSWISDYPRHSTHQ